MTVVDLYTIQIVRDDERDELLGPLLQREVDPDDAAALMAETEENLTDLLPAGYRARIRRWDDNSDEPTQEDEDE